MNPSVFQNFLSPISGRVLCDFNYVLVGNKKNIATPSPILIDIRLDLIKIRADITSITGADFVIGHPTPILRNAQVLSKFADGFVYSTAGVVSTRTSIPPGSLDLSWGHLFVGDLTGKAVDTAVLPKTIPVGSDSLPFYGRVEFRTALHIENMAPLSPGKIWKGDGNSRPSEVDFPTSGAPTNATYVVRKKSDLDNLPNAQSLEALFDIFGIPNPLSTGAILWAAGPADPFHATGTIREATGGGFLPLPLFYDYVNQLGFDAYQAAIRVELTAIDLAITALQEELAALTSIVTALGITVAGLVTTVADLVLKSKRPLNQIALDNKGTGDVDINNYKVINVADPINPLDAVNLRTLVDHVPTDITVQSNTWYVDSVNGNDTFSGSIFAPFKTIQKAINATPNNNFISYTVYISNAIYTENLTITNRKMIFKSAGNQDMLYSVFLQGTVAISFATNSLYGNTVLFEGFLFYANTSNTTLVSIDGGTASITFDRCKFNNLTAANFVYFIVQQPGCLANLYLSNCKFIANGAPTGDLVTSYGGLLDIFGCLFESVSNQYMISSRNVNRLRINTTVFNSFNSTSVIGREWGLVYIANSSPNNTINDCYFTGATNSAGNKAAIVIMSNITGQMVVVTFCYFRVRLSGSDCILRTLSSGSPVDNIQVSSCYAYRGTAEGVNNIGVSKPLLGAAVGNCGDATLMGDVQGFGSIPGIINTQMVLSLGQISTNNPTLVDVDFNLKKAVRMADPSDPLDGVNLQTLERHTGGGSGTYAYIGLLGFPTVVSVPMGPPSANIQFNFVSTIGPENFDLFLGFQVQYTGSGTIDTILGFTCSVTAPGANMSLIFNITRANGNVIGSSRVSISTGIIGTIAITSAAIISPSETFLFSVVASRAATLTFDNMQFTIHSITNPL